MKPGIPSQVKDGQSSFKQFPSHFTKMLLLTTSPKNDKKTGWPQGHHATTR